MISVLDLGFGNVGSIVNILKYINVECKVINSKNEIENSSKIIFPGVGSWDNGVEILHKKNILHTLEKKVVKEQTPILGICLGMQLLLESSEEGDLPGLGWISGHVKKFKVEEKNLKVPHMGWNIVKATRKNILAEEFSIDTRFYFVHSYHATDTCEENIIFTCNYGYEFICGINKMNMWGVQFHPEKSHKFGMKLFKKFSEL
ncbi:imidazole glycerol phosphate synthase subunit HisH [Zooshikella marina]|uniref:imidazole glycerol phosphate synthase subunit HisH n=1 Tax=Zooshikella ganghwensis TaxID=202772 RepID=UPI001BAF3FCF|nr:imidazole glycerol phosphate synthase subunit HisH [Zooshikella ganghwensis]MBU2704614.1 imidazole glycerol phosphate synthase subunit HisH [Zooshikella ganghwensis]